MKNINPLIVDYEKRIRELLKKEKKSAAVYKEIEFLQKQLKAQYSNVAKLATAQKAVASSSADNNTSSKSKAKKGAKKNDVTKALKRDPTEIKRFPFFKYQQDAIDSTERWQWYLKPRQIGFTFAMAQKMWNYAMKGETSTWISASKPQAHVARDYIKTFAFDEYGLKLIGTDDIILYKDGKIYAKMLFRGSNKSTGQSYSGHLFIDEIFWLPDFNNVERAARGIATHKKYQKIYFSTPSYVTHGAYEMWRGDPDQDIISGKKQGGIFREIITLEQAIADGAGAFLDIDILREENDDESYSQLYGLQFLDDTFSIFKFAKLQLCGVEPLDWDDFEMDESGDRIYTGDGVVWAGFDPAPRRDFAKLVLLAIPDEKHKYYRKIFEHEWKGVQDRAIANDIIEILSNYNVESLVIDRNGSGEGVSQLLEAALPFITTSIDLNDAIKQKMVTKTSDLINTKKLRWNQREYHIPNAFMRIKSTPNRNSSRTLIKTARTRKTGNHGDTAWAMMNALYNHEMAEVQESSFTVIH